MLNTGHPVHIMNPGQDERLKSATTKSPSCFTGTVVHCNPHNETVDVICYDHAGTKFELEGLPVVLPGHTTDAPLYVTPTIAELAATRTEDPIDVSRFNQGVQAGAGSGPRSAAELGQGAPGDPAPPIAPPTEPPATVPQDLTQSQAAPVPVDPMPATTPQANE